jgi:hypothetical protein
MKKNTLASLVLGTQRETKLLKFSNLVFLFSFHDGTTTAFLKIERKKTPLDAIKKRRVFTPNASLCLKYRLTLVIQIIQI